MPIAQAAEEPDPFALSPEQLFGEPEFGRFKSIIEKTGSLRLHQEGNAQALLRVA